MPSPAATALAVRSARQSPTSAYRYRNFTLAAVAPEEFQEDGPFYLKILFNNFAKANVANDAEVIRKYIRNQEAEDRHLDQLEFSDEPNA